MNAGELFVRLIDEAHRHVTAERPVIVLAMDERSGTLAVVARCRDVLTARPQERRASNRNPRLRYFTVWPVDSFPPGHPHEKGWVFSSPRRVLTLRGWIGESSGTAEPGT